nr:hypothetical protein [Tanacetum cinerariifolium]
AGSNPDETSEGQAGPDPGDARAEVQSIPNPVVHAGLDREHMDLNVADVSPQPSTEQLDEGFTATAYLKVQENLKLAVKEHVLLKDPASSSGTLSSLEQRHGGEVGQTWVMSVYARTIRHPLTGPSRTSGAPGASGSSQVPPTPPPPLSTNQDNLEMDEDMGPDEQAQSLDDEDIGSAHIPKVNLRQDWWKPFEEERPATLEPAWSIRSSNVPIPTNNWASALASNYSPPPEESLLAQTGDIATFMDWFCTTSANHYHWVVHLVKSQSNPTYSSIKIWNI